MPQSYKRLSYLVLRNQQSSRPLKCHTLNYVWYLCTAFTFEEKYLSWPPTGQCMHDVWEPYIPS
jgi:hypothetical protein